MGKNSNKGLPYVKYRFICPVCSNEKWQKLEKYKIPKDTVTVGRKWKQRIEFLPSAIRILLLARPARQPICKRHISNNQFRRRRAYFDIGQWPEAFESICCNKCGFICYTPRPTAQELEATYMFLEKHDPFYDGPYDRSPETAQMDRQRSERVYKVIKPYLNGNAVLDFGGANGIILTAFRDNGLQCHLADYSDRQLPGINKVANSLNDLQGTYDCILLNHVLEHVAEPGDLLSGLNNHLNQKGLLYVEVPVEILAGVPRLEKDPVPHVNFFTDGSLKTILRLNGYKVLSVFRGWSSYGRTMAYVTSAVAMKGNEQATFEPNITDALLYPKRIHAIDRFWKIVTKQASEL